MSLKLEVRNVRLVVVDKSLQGRPPASAQDAPKTGAKNRGKNVGRGARFRSPLGLGDAVERVAKPIAKGIDRLSACTAGSGVWLGPFRWYVRPTKLAGCTACSWRRKMLNWLLPDVRSWRAWRGAVGKLGIAWRVARSRYAWLPCPRCKIEPKSPRLMRS